MHCTISIPVILVLVLKPECYTSTTFAGGFQCHCEDDVPCDFHTGSCPTGCDGDNRVGTMWPGDWSGPGCQEGDVIMCELEFSISNIDRYSKYVFDINAIPDNMVAWGHKSDNQICQWRYL